MAFRRSGRSAAQESATNAEESRLIGNESEIVWRMYSRYSPVDHGAWCITGATYDLKGKISETKIAERIDNELRFIKFDTDPDIKRFYNKEEWVILAGPPETRPSFGKPVPLRPGDRAGMMEVPKGEKTAASTIKSRINNLRKDFERGIYPGEDTTWFGNIRQTPGLVEWYEAGAPEPIVSITRNSAQINTGQTRFGHDPENIVFGSHITNPQSRYVPSTAAIPVTTYIPYMGEVIAIIALAKSIAEYLNRGSSRDRYGYTFITHPTEVIDYAELKSRAQ